MSVLASSEVLHLSGCNLTDFCWTVQIFRSLKGVAEPHAALEDDKAYVLSRSLRAGPPVSTISESLRLLPAAAEPLSTIISLTMRTLPPFASDMRPTYTRPRPTLLNRQHGSCEATTPSSCPRCLVRHTTPSETARPLEEQGTRPSGPLTVTSAGLSRCLPGQDVLCGSPHVCAGDHSVRFDDGQGSTSSAQLKRRPSARWCPVTIQENPSIQSRTIQSRVRDPVLVTTDNVALLVVCPRTLDVEYFITLT